MKMSTVKNVLYNVVINRRRCLLVGPPGLGKTALLHWLKAQFNCKMTILYASISDPTDFKGFYCLVNGKPEIMPFGELEAIINSTELHIVFLDDLGLGMNAVQGAAMSFLDRIKSNPNVVVIGATNRKEDRANVVGLIEPVKSRLGSIIPVEFDLDQWVSDFAMEEVEAGRMPLSLVAFSKFRPSLMYSGKPTMDLINSPCPRTVAELGEWMMMDLAPEAQYESYLGIVGEAYTSELMGFLPIWKKLMHLTPDAILMNPDTVDLPAISDEYGPSIYFAVCSALARKATENTMDRIIKFADRLPPEFAVSLVVDCVKNDKECQNTAGYIGWQSRNKNFLI